MAPRRKGSGVIKPKSTVKQPVAGKVAFDGTFYTVTGKDADSGHYYELAKLVASLYPGKSVLDVGCGLGFLTNHLLNSLMNARGLDDSAYAVEHAVVPITSGDILNVKDSYNIVVCKDMLNYLDGKMVDKVLKKFHQVATDVVIIYIMTLEVASGLPTAASIRMFSRPLKWWVTHFENAGFVAAPKTDAVVKQTGWKGFFILEKKKNE